MNLKKCVKINFIISPHYNIDEYSEKLEAMIKAHSVVGIALGNWVHKHNIKRI